MTGAVTLLQLRTQAKSRADMVNSSFIADLEWNSFLSNSYKELYDILVSAYGNNYFSATPCTFVTSGTSAQFALPSDFYKLLGVDLQLSPGNTSSFVTLKQFNFTERNRYTYPNQQTYFGVTNLKYRLNGQNLWLSPLPAAGQTIQVWYVPEPTALVYDTDTFDGISGWEEYVIVDAAIKAKDKEESDVSVLMAQKNALLMRIQAMASDRDAANPQTVSDVLGEDFYMGGV